MTSEARTELTENSSSLVGNTTLSDLPTGARPPPNPRKSHEEGALETVPQNKREAPRVRLDEQTLALTEPTRRRLGDPACVSGTRAAGE